LSSSTEALPEPAWTGGCVSAPERLQVDMDVERVNNYFLTRLLLNGADDFAVSRTNNVPEFSFTTVSENEIGDAVMFIRSDVVGVNGITLSFKNLLLHVVLPMLTIFL
jgi:hypothetical protein